MCSPGALRKIIREPVIFPDLPANLLPAMFFSPSSPALLLSLLFTGTSMAATVISDDFDTGAVNAGWDAANGTSVISGGAQASSNAVRLAASTGALGETFNNIAPGGADGFVIDYYFRVQNTTNRQFSLIVSTNSTAPNVNSAALNLRYQAGTWAAFSTTTGNAFVNIPTSGANSLPVVTADVWYHMQVEGLNWGSSSATYTLRLSDAGGTAFTSTAAGLTFNQTSAGPGMITNKAQSFVFNSAFGSNPGFDLDNISVTAVPEPAAPLLAGLALLGLTRRRRD